MIKQINKKHFAAILTICLSIVFLSGCDRQAKHKVLTFFFTGVPPLDGEGHAGAEGTNVDIMSEEFRNTRIATPEFTRKVPSYAHGPFAAGQCNHCHATGSSAVLRRTGTVQETKQQISAMQLQNVSARLIVPLRELCIDCHTAKSVTSAYNEGLWVHGPVSDGLCTVCHNPHQSPYRYMLLKGNSKDMCASCHTEGFIRETEDHLSGKDCTECHNPHVGKTRYLLKKDYNESF